MKIIKAFIFSSVLLFTLLGHAQNMQEGFTFLETGKYAEAETFFNKILKDYPENKTARLCYGRAIGLNGKAAEANTLFIGLLEDYPTDFEVKLNYGESLLWNNNFEEAKSYYSNLVVEEPESFPALLGYANTLSNLKEYESALNWVNKALEVSPGNPNAMVSKKYIYLGYAYQNQQAQDYLKAETILNETLTLYIDDKDALLNLANLYLISNELDKAEATYNRLAENPEHEINALNGLALVSHLNGKEKDALLISQSAYNRLNEITDESLAQQTTERYIQALIWNKQYKQAETLIDAIIVDQPNENWILALRATLNIYKSDFKKSVSDYNRILENDSISFDGNLGKANALKALGYYDGAYTSAENTLTFYANQKDATNFINQLDVSFTPSLDSRASYTIDNGDNRAFSSNNAISFPLSTKFQLLGSYNLRTTKNKITNNEATSNDASLGLSYQLLNNITFQGTAGITSANTFNNRYNQLLVDVLFKVKPLKLQTLDIGYKREVQNFNADLLDREIVQNNFYANYNISTNFNLGWFTQYFYTSQSDGNNRNLFFTSLYYNVLSKPSLKVGLNYQYITFKDQVPVIYFSPEKFNAGEVFVNLIRDEVIAKPKEWFYELTAGIGMQFIEDDGSQLTYRFQGKLGYKLTERSLLNLYGTQSNIASATAAGFTFTEVGLRFKWLIFEKPVFRE